MSGSANASAACTGDCSASANANMTMSATQTMRVDGNVGGGYARPVGRVRGTYTAPGYARVPVYVVENTDGRVRLEWGYRGGTCHVRYTEATQSVYKYATAASCDEGGVTIGGLVPGKKYRFQVRQNEGGWSRAVVVKAG
jgi:hypothetical protein